MSRLDEWIGKGWLPDFILRAGIRRQLKHRLELLDQSAAKGFQAQWVETLKSSPIAVMTGEANQQHYEVPTDFFCQVLGRHMKYSSGNWAVSDADLDDSESAMLRLTMQRAELADGQRILELGCGWGSLSLEMARTFSKARITAVSNSKTQKEWIDSAAQSEGLTNLEVITADINHFETAADQFDRVVSVEMFEHLRNYDMLFEKIARWLKKDGKMFVHIFCHKEYSYPFDPDPSSWMATYFFSGGIMPSENLFRQFSRDMQIVKTWKVSGMHYHRTCEAWLKRADQRKKSIIALFKGTYGDDAVKWFHFWRVFFLACSELFRYNQGNEWYVCHYLFEKVKNS